MKKLFNRFWIIFTIVLCGLFIIIFMPLSVRSHGFARALSYTVTGVAVIWIVYFIRASIFSSPAFTGEDEQEGDEIPDLENRKNQG